MKIRPYVNKLNDSPEFKDFKKTHPGAFMIAGFFILDFESGKNTHQIDYYVPAEKKVAAFTLDNHVVVQMLDLMDKRVPEKMDLETNIDLEALYGILEDEMKNRSITETVQKIIAVVQSVEGKKLWYINCLLSGMGLLRAHVDDESKTILKMEKLSIMDFVKKVPGSQLGQIMQGKQGKQGKEIPEVQSEKKTDLKSDIKKQIENLDKLEEAIEEEKEELQKQVDKSKVKKQVKKKK